MIRIVKNTEPLSWIEIRKTPGVTFESADKKDLRKALLDEQGLICGYCMRRIKYGTSKIEHIKAQSADHSIKNTLNYNNLIICCDGNIMESNNSKDFHCDTKKGESNISFSPLDAKFTKTLTYSSKDGRIKSENPQFDKEINETLNLNLPILKSNRLAVLQGVIKILSKRENWKEADIKSQLKNWISKDSKGRFKEYCGIVIWFLSKKTDNRQHPTIS